MKTRLTTLLLVVLSSTSFAQTWLEKSMNGLNYGPSNPPATIIVTPYSEPFDTSWRDGFVGIGTPEWPKTKLQVHGLDDVDVALTTFLVNNTGSADHTISSAIFSNGGTSGGGGAISSLSFTSRSSVSGAVNIGAYNVAEGDNIETNTGTSSQASGSNNLETIGSTGIGFGNNNRITRGVVGAAAGNGQNLGNIGVTGQCESTDASAVNIGVYGRGINASEDQPALINIGVHGRAECSGGGGGGTQFNCGVYGQNAGCNSGSGSSAGYPSGYYAGYFDGDLYYTGTLMGPSDQKLKQNIQPLQGVLERLGKVKTYSYNFKPNTGLSLPIGTIEYGVLSQELEKVFPELVQDVNVLKQGEKGSYRNIESIKSVEYLNFIPLLVQANNELNEKLQSLDPEKTAAALAALKEKIAALEKNLESAAVGQNKDLDSYLNAYPNPTTSEMTIDVKRLNCNDCVLMITDLSGKLVRQYEIRSTEEKFRLSANDFQSGVYQCNLIADGKVASGIKIAFTKN